MKIDAVFLCKSVQAEPKTLECGENHLLKPEFNIIPSKRQFIIDDYLYQMLKMYETMSCRSNPC